MAMQQLEAVRSMKFRKPFASFWIITSTGDRLLVEDRFQFAIGMTRMHYVYPDAVRAVELTADKIAAVEVVEQKPAA